ncbi:MAG: Gfo/Idh/MocA family oxidoreductase [Phycisphaeraceae bacterium]|nr:Gfo/Idh/MocA family oxidoreductase [Phycisphaeraceae bacterium]
MSKTRREFIKQGALAALSAGPMAAAMTGFSKRAGAGPQLAPAIPGRVGANERLAVAFVGVGGMGGSDLGQVSSHPGVEVVALCDMNLRAMEKAAEKFSSAVMIQDWREIIPSLGDRVDAIVCSTPDHMHAPVAMTALNHDKHIYCQKPLARLAYENRQLARVAATKPRVMTQMGTQRFARAERRQGLALLQQGVVGRAKALYGWTDRPAGWWPCGENRPAGDDPVPEWLGWNLFLGVAPLRPFVKDAYTPFKWRGYYDFGTGAIGDMGCHIMDVPFMALELTGPLTITCSAPNATEDQFPSQESIRMTFAATPRTAGPLPFYWFDGGRRPDLAEIGLPTDLKLPNNDGAAIVVGEDGILVQPCDSAAPMVFRDGRQVEVSLPEAATTNHWHDWVDACLGKGRPRAPFELAGPLCEMLSLGAIASRFNEQTLEFNDQLGTITNNTEANSWVRRPYRAGWEVPNL